MCIADGSQLVVAAGARVFVYDLEGNPVHSLKGHGVCSVTDAFSPAQVALATRILETLQAQWC